MTTTDNYPIGADIFGKVTTPGEAQFLMDNDAEVRRHYRRFRAAGYQAKPALHYARTYVLLDDVRGDNDYEHSDAFVTVRWEYDQDFEPWGEPEIIEEETRQLAAGTWEVHGCIVSCGDDMASLWGIVGPFDHTDRAFRDAVECDLFNEIR